MRLKLAISALISAVLLLTSCAASACEASCDASNSQPSCHRTQSASGDEMASMPGMVHPAPSVMLDAIPCIGHVCAQQSTSLKDNSCPKRFLVSAMGVALIETSNIATFEPIRSDLADETPPPLKLSPIALHTTLRV